MKLFPVLGLTLVLCFNPIQTNADPITYEQAQAQSYGMQPQPAEEVAPVEQVEVKSYSDDDLYYLSRTIWAEARGEGRHGMMHVGSVVLNRVKSPRWPSTIKSVVLQRNQFTVWRPNVSPRIRSVTESERTYATAVEVAKHLMANGPINNYQSFEASRIGGRGTRIGNHIFR